jgi:predicted nuclease with TOPRIM domain
MPPANATDHNVVQDLLAQLRSLKVENERLRLESQEAKARIGKPDPRLERLEQENRRLREELAAARSERDALSEAVASCVARLKRL